MQSKLNQAMHRLEYFEEWTVQFEDIKNFHQVALRKKILWEHVEKYFECISNHFPKNICENDPFDEDKKICYR